MSYVIHFLRRSEFGPEPEIIRLMHVEAENPGNAVLKGQWLWYSTDLAAAATGFRVVGVGDHGYTYWWSDHPELITAEAENDKLERRPDHLWRQPKKSARARRKAILT